MGEKTQPGSDEARPEPRSGAADTRCYVLESVPKNQILHLTLKKKWFDLIKSGIKKEEYREIKSYWRTRLLHSRFDIKYILFRNGYHKNSPIVIVKYLGLSTGYGVEEWGANKNDRVFILHLGEVIYTDSGT